MDSIDWSSLIPAAIVLVLTTRLCLVAVRAPEPNDDVPDFLPSEGRGAFTMLLSGLTAIVIATASPTEGLADRIVAGTWALSGANMLLVACQLFRIHRIKNLKRH